MTEAMKGSVREVLGFAIDYFESISVYVCGGKQRKKHSPSFDFTAVLVGALRTLLRRLGFDQGSSQELYVNHTLVLPEDFSAIDIKSFLQFDFIKQYPQLTVLLEQRLFELYGHPNQDKEVGPAGDNAHNC